MGGPLSIPSSKLEPWIPLYKVRAALPIGVRHTRFVHYFADQSRGPISNVLEMQLEIGLGLAIWIIDRRKLPI